MELSPGEGRVVGITGTQQIPQELLGGQLRPFLVRQDRDNGILLLSRDPSSGIRRLVGQSFVNLVRLDRVRVLEDILRVDSSSQWVVAGAIDLGGGLMVTISDLKSDRRLLVRLNDAGVVKACRMIASPYALMAASADGRFAVAGVWDKGSWLLVYEVQSSGRYHEGEISSCAV
ncbi:MAG: hypothetical protein SFU57_07320 [Gemmatimonadales bacterium]|nr:hypothetical protein [Gemmatimonadales bacterium]